MFARAAVPPFTDWAVARRSGKWLGGTKTRPKADGLDDIEDILSASQARTAALKTSQRAYRLPKLIPARALQPAFGEHLLRDRAVDAPSTELPVSTSLPAEGPAPAAAAADGTRLHRFVSAGSAFASSSCTTASQVRHIKCTHARVFCSPLHRHALRCHRMLLLELPRYSAFLGFCASPLRIIL